MATPPGTTNKSTLDGSSLSWNSSVQNIQNSLEFWMSLQCSCNPSASPSSVIGPLTAEWAPSPIAFSFNWNSVSPEFCSNVWFALLIHSCKSGSCCSRNQLNFATVTLFQNDLVYISHQWAEASSSDIWNPPQAACACPPMPNAAPATIAAESIIFS